MELNEVRQLPSGHYVVESLCTGRTVGIFDQDDDQWKVAEDTYPMSSGRLLNEGFEVLYRLDLHKQRFLDPQADINED